MSANQVFELRDEPDKLPGFLQVYSTNKPDSETWKEDIGIRSREFGSRSFGANYKPVLIEFNNEGKRKKNSVGDICLSMRPFIIFSDKARQALDAILSPVGEFLPVAAPVPGFVGYRVLKHLNDCIDIERSMHTKYDNGNVLVRKATMYTAKVRGHDIFAVSNAVGGLFISDAFKAVVELAKLKGFDFSKEVPLV